MKLVWTKSKYVHNHPLFCQESVSEESVRRFCKECANIRVVRSGSSIAAAEFEGKSPHRDVLILKISEIIIQITSFSPTQC